MLIRQLHLSQPTPTNYTHPAHSFTPQLTNFATRQKSPHTLHVQQFASPEIQFPPQKGATIRRQYSGRKFFRLSPPCSSPPLRTIFLASFSPPPSLLLGAGYALLAREPFLRISSNFLRVFTLRARHIVPGVLARGNAAIYFGLSSPPLLLSIYTIVARVLRCYFSRAHSHKIKRYFQFPLYYFSLFPPPHLYRYLHLYLYT